jgi:hypothetical protein
MAFSKMVYRRTRDGGEASAGALLESPGRSMSVKKARPKTIDEYISAAPKAAQKKLREMRACIRKSAPARRKE